MERDYDYSSVRHAADLDSADNDRPQRRRSARWRASIRARCRRARCRWCSTAASPDRWSRISPSAANGASVARKTSFLRDKMGAKTVRRRHPHHRRSLAQARPALAPVRRRGRGRQEAGADRGRRAAVLAARLRDRARTRADDHRPRPARRVVDALAGRRPICIWKRARSAPDELIADIKDGFYVTDLIGMGVNMVTGDYSRGASGFWIENGKRTLSGERGHHRRPSARHVPHAHARPTISNSATPPMRRRCGWRA